MLLATSRHNHHLNWDICRIRTPSFCIPLSKKSAVNVLTQWCTVVFMISCSKEREMCGKCLLSSDMVNLLFSPIFSFTWSSRSAVTKDGWPLQSLSWTFVIPTPSSHHSITHSIFSLNLPINFSQANIFGIQKFYHWPYLTTGGVFIFILISRQNYELINVSDVTFSAPEISPHRHTPFTPPVRLACTIGTYFLDMPHILD
jgi:hypothetical protein